MLAYAVFVANLCFADWRRRVLFLIVAAVVPILADWSMPQAHLHLLSPPSRLRPARVKALSDHLVDTLKISCTGAHAQYLALHKG